MATHHSTPAAAPARLPYFTLCEQSGRYQARRTLTPEQIIRAAKAALSHQFTRKTVITSTEVVADYLTVHYSTRPAETFVVLFLDNKHRLISIEELFHGTIDSASVHPRELVRRCIELSAAAVILGHNHPSGITEPSVADLRITERIKATLDLMDIRVLDHLIVGGGKHCSLAARGLL
ncbi:DNA repair protein RadC [Lamprobacter modestohalophilus]|uniref:RadC family protein n=1 Tax=Lamprobacter modestohalophilus TaxID=1064514 RepID=UPI002ADEC828|nr:DNA repair protein RadC [Lamprobacter modestohalophilus]MEA1048575.1 DNA repair protein RadC [Lamprobacter modestohalophilus]